MKFQVESNKHSQILEANDFNHAVQLFLTSIVDKGQQPSLGQVISVTANVSDSLFFLTCDALAELNTNHLKLVSE